ncbi:37590_t:CDS:2 [Gigaspora margarita]|uniref:37590_t:CDS:1 n=1 Tax=Gigaspora margarita TaxID=4874 RepID=A0ABN7X0C5_GIGMA|nr:37590_t:CDS:2 [Gigaspora margarita]
MQLEEIDYTIWLEDYEQKPKNIKFKIHIEKGRIGESKCLCALLNTGILAFALNVEKKLMVFGIKNIYNVLQKQEFKYFDVNLKEISFGDFRFHFVGNFKSIHFIIYDSTQGSFYNGTSQEKYIKFMEVKKQFVPEYFYGFLIVENCEFETILNSVGKIFFTTWNNLHILIKECVIKELERFI